MLVQSNSPRTVALDRVIQVVLGIMVAVAATLVIFPRHARQVPHHETGQETHLAKEHTGENSE